MLTDCIMILMEASPKEDVINQKALIKDMKSAEMGDDIKILDFHLWQISNDILALSCHVECNGEPMGTLKKLTELCRDKYKITSVTIQIEDSSDGIQIHDDDMSPMFFKPQQSARGISDEHEHHHHEEEGEEEAEE